MRFVIAITILLFTYCASVAILVHSMEHGYFPLAVTVAFVAAFIGYSKKRADPTDAPQGQKDFDRWP